MCASKRADADRSLSCRCAQIADDVQDMVVADSGHFVPEKQPAPLARGLLDYFAKAPSIIGSDAGL